jgi:hypothetical protein
MNEEGWKRLFLAGQRGPLNWWGCIEPYLAIAMIVGLVVWGWAAVGVVALVYLAILVFDAVRLG